ncbi:ATP-dependent DNA helicase [Zymomonas mobilis]|uniref:Helicase c2 n=1 Tax=Zymomonas mobilis subsp. pomaceae (strain ATCC 29192 / DSM 22645 / JCM 10191 / CCUG 17912 / NBRC 13757 / NCIMB 11200 / NRRL B-4491 / Barker I) TaxID=579138 RepID=F8EUY9_ZYMMT|nr:ATP-dependent DNA helicase [Zymomonas mobilis]AEI37277.1 helicase c2 [Zymomonas mobilis subsp. pomaceae ATCC 29192]MDX5948646.1 ATP-dependent DNA helicase [Zymomonas mobilis subsp. pomaceae]GEB88451.1 DNA helicase [Zymomonas mobilis subsp. pomaceae]
MTESLFSEDRIPPALYATHAGIWIAFANGDVRSLDRTAALNLLQKNPVIVLNTPMMASRLKIPEISALDILELFAFVYPACFTVPTPRGLAKFLDIPLPTDEVSTAVSLHHITAQLLKTVTNPKWQQKEGAWDSATALARHQWNWSHFLSQYLIKPRHPERWLFSRLAEWEESAPKPPARPVILSVEDSDASLSTILGQKAEIRTEQRRYTQNVSQIFRPRLVEEEPHFLLAQAGTGIGKTLGYLAPATKWAEQSGGTVWISTYTKALQKQLGRESERIFPDDKSYKKNVVVRKGRENYLCLLNLEEALQGNFRYRSAILAHLIARWAAYTRDGDMIGGDLPGWLISLFRRNGALSLTDRRGECIYAACPHFRRCFIEHAVRATDNASLVIANHALVMLLASRSGPEGNGLERLIFDEGHHLFEAADATFSFAFTGRESSELRRWLTGAEGRSRRRRGFAEMASYDEQVALSVELLKEAARILPSDSWLTRLSENKPRGVIEKLFHAIRDMVYARAASASKASGYGIEAEIFEPDGEVIAAAHESKIAIHSILEPLISLGKRLEQLLHETPDWLTNPIRGKIESLINGLENREDLLSSWLTLLERLSAQADPRFIDWLAVDRIEGREYDIGIHRHWLDPTEPLAEHVFKPSHGLLVTSATLGVNNTQYPSQSDLETEAKSIKADWTEAERRSGARYLNSPLLHFQAQSPFDYTSSAEIFIVNDIPKNNIAALSNGYVRLLEASEGGALGLFSSIQRLRGVYTRIADHLARQGLSLYAQHVDPMDTGTLVDIFRDDPQASLLGTDALRDGIDVPGNSLRLVVMEGLPWPRPTVAHAARRMAYGGCHYDDQIIRAKLAQGFGRLIRRQGDKGAFVLLSSAVPSRLLNAFPEGIKINRLPLDIAVERIKAQCRIKHD